MAQAQPDLQIFIKPCVPTIGTLADARTFELMVQVPNVVGNIMFRVARRLDIPAEHLRLAHRGTPLHDGDDLSAHNIMHGDTIEVMLRGGGGGCYPLRPSEERQGGLGGVIKVREVA